MNEKKRKKYDALCKYAGVLWLIVWVLVFSFSNLDVAIGLPGTVGVLYIGSIVLTIGLLKYFTQGWSMRAALVLPVISLLGLFVAFVFYYYLSALNSIV